MSGASPMALALTLSAFWRARARAKRLRTRDQLLKWQSARLERFLRAPYAHSAT